MPRLRSVTMVTTATIRPPPLVHKKNLPPGPKPLSADDPVLRKALDLFNDSRDRQESCLI